MEGTLYALLLTEFYTNQFKTLEGSLIMVCIYACGFGIIVNLFSSRGLCPWRAYVVTQSLVSASVSFRIGSALAPTFELAQCLSFKGVHSFLIV